MKSKQGGRERVGQVRDRPSRHGRLDAVCAGKQHLPDDLAVYLSQALSDWFRQRPHLRVRCVVPIQKDGDTVELHAWYDAHLFQPVQGPAPSGQ